MLIYRDCQGAYIRISWGLGRLPRQLRIKWKKIWRTKRTLGLHGSLQGFGTEGFRGFYLQPLLLGEHLRAPDDCT